MKVAIIFNILLLTISAYGAVMKLIPNIPSVNESKFFNLARNVTPCYEDDPELIECVKRAMAVMKSELLNLLPPDPIVVAPEDAELISSLLKYGTKIENIKIYGQRNFDFRDIRLNINGNSLELDFKLFYPLVDIQAKLTHNIGPVPREGYINETLTDVSVKFHMIGHVTAVNNKRFFEVDQLKHRSIIGRIEVHIRGIGETPLEDEIIQSIVNHLLQNTNSKFKMLLQRNTEEAEEELAPIMKESMIAILRSIPYDSVIKGNSISP